jgi:hypothetical protein
MTKNDNLKELELKLKKHAFLSFHGDGLIDILMGWIVVGTGIFLYSHSTFFSTLTIFCLFLYYPLKYWITLPRLGHARFRTRRTPSMWIIGGVGGLLVLFAIINGVVLRKPLGVAGPIALAIFGLAFVMVLISGFNRILAYLILFPLFIVVGLGLKFLTPTLTIAVGAGLMLYGIWQLVNFIRSNPKLAEAEEIG